MWDSQCLDLPCNFFTSELALRHTSFDSAQDGTGHVVKVSIQFSCIYNILLTKTSGVTSKLEIELDICIMKKVCFYSEDDYLEGKDTMKHNRKYLIYLLVTILFLMSACGNAVITLPPDEPTSEPVETEAVEPPEAVEASLDSMLKAGTVLKWFDDGYLVFVPEGEVTLGDNQFENNLPYTVFLDGYWIYMFQITNGQYHHCVLTGSCTPPADEEPYPDYENLRNKDKPVIGVTWEQAGEYCEWMNARLPSKAEWEKAARGPDSYTYPWGEDDPDCDLLNYEECEGQDTTNVYEYPDGRSYYQAFDLAGNAYEWVFDLYEDDFIAQLPGEEPAGPLDGTERSVRGSSYQSEDELIPSAQLFYHEPDQYRTDLGFRCVIGEAELESAGFNHPCIRTVSVPGNPLPEIPDPPPGGPGDPPDFPEPQCKVEVWANSTNYCSNIDLQHGGLDLTYGAIVSNDVYVNSWSSSQGVVCNTSTNPAKCFGPENTPVDFEVCATCSLGVDVKSDQYYCAPGYYLVEGPPPFCEYNACPPQVPPPCPQGFWHDQQNDICLLIVMQTGECPGGYFYNQDTDCCEAAFAPTTEDLGPVPDASYLICPPGTGNVVLINEVVPQGQNYALCRYLSGGGLKEYCIDETHYLGDCREIPKEKCKNPGQYTTKNSCENHGCNWVGNPTGLPGGSCKFP